MTDLPAGFQSAGVYCGLKKKAGCPDISLVVCDGAAVAAGVYTQNLVRAAPVELDRARTPSANIRAVVTNSGNANACTGEQGRQDALAMARVTADACGIRQDQVLVMSTGVIGERLDMTKVEAGIRDAAKQLGTGEKALRSAARGIMTTDTIEKIAARNVVIGDQQFAITGMAKGSGMIAPNMATMLGLIMTDACFEPQVAQAMLHDVVQRTFNCVSVDGHTSTNDTVLLLASGGSNSVPLAGKALSQFAMALEEICGDLSRAIVEDGEGATHVMEIQVRGCARREDAMQIGRTVAHSPLVKTAIAGADPNWGRIVSAAGYAGPQFDPLGVSLSVNGTPLYRSGAPVDFDAAAVSQSMRASRYVQIELAFAEGAADARFWTCDLTVEYVHINAEYHT